MHNLQLRRPGAEFGERKNFRGRRFLNDGFFTAKISDDLFLVIDQVSRIFPFFFKIFRIFTMLNVVYDPFLTRKTPFFTPFILSRASDNTTCTSQNIRGRMHGPSHTSNLGGLSPQSLRGLRLCIFVSLCLICTPVCVCVRKCFERFI